MGNLSLLLGQLSIIFASFAIPYIFIIIPQFRGQHVQSFSVTIFICIFKSVGVDEERNTEECYSTPQYD